MPIDLDKAVGAELTGTTFSWAEEDVILYHLGIGAGDPPSYPDELRYAYEGDLHVLPTYATIPQFSIMMTELSTMIPKSIAPRLRRLAAIPA